MLTFNRRGGGGSGGGGGGRTWSMTINPGSQELATKIEGDNIDVDNATMRLRSAHSERVTVDTVDKQWKHGHMAKAQTLLSRLCSVSGSQRN
ncbi:GH11644 [Drosophila grimshawi]|uniref:GH11644 n=1 Tax=Drosophila grimshawi TaxID=7222 RepID=B4JCC1_DROGR|nr:GH11644 [Drosophila grimshawi]